MGCAWRSMQDTRETKGLVSYSFHIHELLSPQQRAVLLNMLADIRRVLSQFMPSLIATGRTSKAALLKTTLRFTSDECETELQFRNCVENKKIMVHRLLCQGTMVSNEKYFFVPPNYFFLTIYCLDWFMISS